MRIGGLLFIIVVIVAALWFVGILDFNVNDVGELPDVSIEGGRAPDVDVTIQRPEVEITPEEKTITVPDIDVRTPEEPAEAR